MKNLKNDMEPAGEQMILFSPAGSRNYANHTAQPESDLEKRMSATSGRKCLEQFGKFNHVGLWAKTFSELLIGTGDWYSTRCRLTWKLKGTKYKRMFFQLAPSTRRTDGIGFGLWPTPLTDMRDRPSERNRNTPNLESMALMKLLPTPNARDEKNGGKMEDGRIQRKLKQGYTVELNDLATMGLLPTPNAQDGKNSTAPPSQAGRDTLPGMVSSGGTTSQLNPRFCLEMMGFPPDWTELPFLSGEMNQLRQQETR